MRLICLLTCPSRAWRSSSTSNVRQMKWHECMQAEACRSAHAHMGDVGCAKQRMLLFVRNLNKLFLSLWFCFFFSDVVQARHFVGILNAQTRQHVTEPHFYFVTFFPQLGLHCQLGPHCTSTWGADRAAQNLEIIRKTLNLVSGVTPVAGSIYGSLSKASLFPKRIFTNEISSPALLLDTKLTLLCVLWRGFISPWIRTLVEKRFHCLFSKKKLWNLDVFLEKRFHCLFSKKKALKSGCVPSFLAWSWGQLPPRGKL